MIARAIDALLEATVVGSFSRVGIEVRQRVGRWEPLDSYRLDGARVVASGVTSGIGRATVAALAECGATIIGLARDRERADKALSNLAPPADGEHRVVTCDLSDFDDVRRAAEELRDVAPSIDRLLHIAGVLPSEYRETSAGVELTLATHLLGPYLLTREVEPSLAQDARVVWVSSGGMYTQPLDLNGLEMTAETYDGSRAYARAKRAQVVTAELLADEYRGRASVHSMHPGWVKTPILEEGLPLFNRLLGPILRTPEQGADTVAWLAASPEAARTSGQFWHDRRRRRTVSWPGTRPSPEARAGLFPWIEERIARASSPEAPRQEPAGRS